MVPLTGLVVKSLITTPAAGASFAPGKVAVAGFAWAGENDIAKVDISIDNGATWQAGAAGRRAGASIAWRRFEFAVHRDHSRSRTASCRAPPTRRATMQPAVSQWNPSGYLWNQYDSVRVEVK